MGCAWDVPGMCMGWAWDGHEMCLGWAWDVPGMGLGCVLDGCEMSMGYTHVYLGVVHSNLVYLVHERSRKRRVSGTGRECPGP